MARVSTPKLVFRVLLMELFYATLLFGPARTLAWPRAWILLGINFVGILFVLVRLQKSDPDLIAERSKSPFQKSQPLVDRVILPLFIASYYGLIAFASFDVFQFRLLPPPAWWVSGLALIVYLLGGGIIYQALRTNRFAVTVVRLQKDRGQAVVDTGVYGIIRHPMYGGAILFCTGLMLWLGSTAATLAAIIPIGLLAVRSVFEERLLRRDLPGYEAYRQRVRYRMIPFVW